MPSPRKPPSVEADQRSTLIAIGVIAATSLAAFAALALDAPALVQHGP